MDVLDQVQTLFGAIAVMGASLSLLMDTFKPTIDELMPADIAENVRVTIMRVLRLLVAIGFVAMSSQTTEVITGVPFLSVLPVWASVILIGSLVSLGSEFSHVILDAIKAWKDGLESKAEERKAITAERVERNAQTVSFVDREAVA